MASRNRLHKTKLKEFREWLISRGWAEEKTKDFWEVLRMRHPKERDPLLVHERADTPEHYTIWGNSEKQFDIWQRFKKPAPPKPRPDFDPMQI